MHLFPMNLLRLICSLQDSNLPSLSAKPKRLHAGCWILTRQPARIHLQYIITDPIRFVKRFFYFPRIFHACPLSTGFLPPGVCSCRPVPVSEVPFCALFSGKRVFHLLHRGLSTNSTGKFQRKPEVFHRRVLIFNNEYGILL